jgi:hypothetical protein
MAASSTITLLRTLEYCKRFVFQRPTAQGNYLEPALTSANTIMQTIVGAPFSWRWNRVVTGFIARPGQQDYTIFNWTAVTPVQAGWVLVDSNGNSQVVMTAGTTGVTIPVWGLAGTQTTDGSVTWSNSGSIGTTVSPTYNFGWIETVSVRTTNASTCQQEWKEISNKLCLALDSAQSRPHDISPQIDTGDGNITFRLMPTPDKAYPVAITIQQKPTLFTSLNQAWAPIPDELSHIYSWGVLSLLFLFADDPRFQLANQKFVAHLLSSHQGLTATQINIFLSQWQMVTGQQIVLPSTIQQGIQARGNL